jgi:hypothetical protein
MLTDGTLTSGKQVSYGLGLHMSTYRGLSTISHNGAVLGYRTAVVRFPDQRFTVVCLCNVSSAAATTLAYRVADVLLEKDLPASALANQPANTAPGLNPLSLAGNYIDSRDHSLWSFTVMDGNLLVRSSQGRTALTPAGGNQFINPGGISATFVGPDGAMKATIINRDDKTLFTGARIEQVHPTETALAAYVGSYTSKELDATYKLSIDNGSLMLRVNWSPPVKLTPTVRDEFDGEHMILVFRRNAQGRVSGISVFARGDRVRNVAFEKAS